VNGRRRLSVALVLVGYIGSSGVLSAAPTHPEPETATAARTRADLARNREALRKVLAAQAHGGPAGHGAAAGANPRAAHGIPGHTMAAPRADAAGSARGAPRQGRTVLGDRNDRDATSAATPGATAKGNSAGPPNTVVAPARTAGATANTAAVPVGSGRPASNSLASLNRARSASPAGTLGGALASNTTTPVHHSPASPVILGGAPVRRNVGYGAIDGNVLRHKP
jgi:hypothetical protein